jgi:bacillolysin
MKIMKNLILLLALISYSGYVFSQNGFDKKKKISEGEKIKTNFEEINGKKSSLNTSHNFNLATLKNRIITDEETGAIIFVENNSFGKNIKNARKSATAMANDYLSSLKKDLRINNVAAEFSLVKEETDDLGFKHVNMVQKYKGIPIYGGEFNIHTNTQGVLENLSGKIFPTPTLITEPAFDGQEAIKRTLEDLSKSTIVQKNGAISKFLDLDLDAAELIILNENKKSILAYHITVRPNILERWVYFMNAQTGEIIDKYNHTCTLDGVVNTTAKDLNGVTQAFSVIQNGQNFYLIDASKSMFKATQSTLPDKPVGAIWTIDAQDSRIDDENQKFSHVTTNNKATWNNKAVSAHTNASKCFDYYQSTFKRNSLNNAGVNIVSVINISDEDGKGLDNAYWNGKFMGYGNGRDGFKPLAGSLDVAGHEMTHGVVESTAKLEYRNQSGALNESFADIFGAMIDRNDWTLGEEVVKSTAYPSGALRSLENPNQGGKNDPGYQPKTMAQYVNLQDTPDEDNGGVHINSGIPNYAFYRFATGVSMTKEKAEQVYYRALTTYMTRTSKFLDVRLAVIQSARDIFKEGQEVEAAKAAFNFVGILDPSPATGGTTTPPGDNSTNNTIPVNPGTESIVVFDPRSVDQSLYAGPFNTNVEIAKINTGVGCLAKPSVTDDGSFVYYVAKDKKIYRIDLTKKTAPVAVSTEAVWRNVAISKDGKRLAALASVTDNYFYIFDLVKNTSKKMLLYNPTYTKGVSTGEVIYADSFEWDYSGQYIVYDAFNKSKSTFGDIEFWDVGILRAWDPLKNTFGDGNVEKMFTNLEEGDNIGNPALAKTNSNIYAFDYFNADDDQFYVLTIDLGKSADNIKQLEKNNDIGYPDFSKADKMVVFNALDGTQSVIKGVNLAADKITKVGTSQVIYTDAKWAVFYAIGTRALPTKEAQVITIQPIVDLTAKSVIEIKATTNSNLPMQYTVLAGDATIGGKTLSVGSNPGKILIRVTQQGDAKYSAASADVTFCINPPAPTLKDNNLTVLATSTLTGNFLFQYYVNNNAVGGQTTKNEFKKDFAGSYTVKAVTTDGCFSAFSNSIGLGKALGTEPKNESFLLKISPNPVVDKIKFSLPDNEIFKNLDLLDGSGKLLFKTQDINKDYSQLVTGVYYIKVYTNKNSYSAKVVKK